MNMFEFVRRSKNDVRVRSMFDKMVFDPSLLICDFDKNFSLVVNTRDLENEDKYRTLSLSANLKSL